jgi:Fur family ferric uptake transcriptional regulator
MDIVDDLKRSGLKNTKCRAAILDILEQSDQPVAADRLFHQLNEKNIMLSFSTVYRTLDALTDKKLVKKLTIAGEEKALFEYNRRGHRHYLICLGCRKNLAIEHCPLKGYEEILKKETDYAISGHKLDIYGYCPDCQKNG